MFPQKCSYKVHVDYTTRSSYNVSPSYNLATLKSHIILIFFYFLAKYQISVIQIQGYTVLPESIISL